MRCFVIGNSSKSIALSVWNTTPEQNPGLYEKQLADRSQMAGITLSPFYAFGLVLRKKSIQKLHFGC
jgi:hypothetical protein